MYRKFQFNEKLKNHLADINPPVRPEPPKSPMVLAANEARTHQGKMFLKFISIVQYSQI